MRQKWKKIERNVSVNDIVLLKDEDTPRNVWPLGRVIDAYPSHADGLVRSALVRTRANHELKRPVNNRGPTPKSIINFMILCPKMSKFCHIL